MTTELTRTDEELAAMAQREDSDALAELCARYEDRARMAAHRFRIGGVDFDDRLSEARVGLIKAVRKYDPSQGCQFATFAKDCMTKALIEAYRRTRRQCEVPHHLIKSIDVSVATAIGSTSGGDMLNGSDSLPVYETAANERDETDSAIERIVAQRMPEAIVTEIGRQLARAILGRGTVTGALRSATLAYVECVYGTAKMADVRELLGPDDGQGLLVGLAPVRGTSQACDEASHIICDFLELTRSVIFNEFDGFEVPAATSLVVVDRTVVQAIVSAVKEVACALFDPA